MTGILVFIFGTIVGSFLNVCIYRIPRGDTVLTGRSRCTSCKTEIKWYDLVPVISYLILGGRCRYCKAKISLRYPFVELLNGVGWFLLYILFGFIFFYVITIIIFSTLLVLIFIKYDNFHSI